MCNCGRDDYICVLENKEFCCEYKCDFIIGKYCKNNGYCVNDIVL